MKRTVFTGSGTALITPMNNDGSVNYKVLEEILEFQIANKTDAIVICGTTGEAATLSEKEHIAVMEFTVQKVNKRIPVVAGAGSNNTAHAMELTKKAKEIGADALLHSTPYYNKTSQAGLIKHFTTLADLTDLPMILYSVPGRTGMGIKANTYLELSKHPNIVATKEASGDISHIAKIAELCGDELAIYSGNDDQIVPIMALGGKGVISVLSNVHPKETHDMCQAMLEGNYAEGRRLQLKLLSLIDALFIDVNPIPVKEAMNLLGYNAGGCRLPLVPMSDSDKEVLIKQLKLTGAIK